MTPPNPKLSLNVPSEVAMGNIQPTLSFYGSIQNSSPFIFNNLILFTVIDAGSNNTGNIYLTIGGLINPKSIGNSSSFVLTLQLSSLPNGGTCTGCTVATIDTGLIAQSTVPGNIKTLTFSNSNLSISAENSISVYSYLVATIPVGGKYQITLPPSIKPKLPLTCSSGYGFTVTGNQPICTYNVSKNTIETTNFAFLSTGGAVFLTTIINPPDTRTAELTFQTFDSNGNMIGNSSTPQALTATPLTLVSTVSKNNSQVDTSFKLTVNLTLGVTLTQNDMIKVTLPPASYNTAGILCYSASVSVACTTTTDIVTNNIVVQLAPPCSNCNAGTTLSFAIDGLTNPSFINSQSEAIMVQTAHP